MPDVVEKLGQAADLVTSNMTIGLGTGSLVHAALERIGDRQVIEKTFSIRVVPANEEIRRAAKALQLPTVPLEQIGELDITIDGADEIDGNANVVQRSGDALLRRKVITSISKRRIVAVERSRLVDQLGTSATVPIEVVPFTLQTVMRALRKLHCVPELRSNWAFQSLPQPSEGMSRRQLHDLYRPMVVSIAESIKKSLSRDILLDDLVEYGLLGVYEAASTYDAETVVSFALFAKERTESSIYDALSNEGVKWVEADREDLDVNTENGNNLVDCTFAEGISNPAEIERSILAIPGVVEVGLFVNAADTLIICDSDGSIEVRDLFTQPQ